MISAREKVDIQKSLPTHQKSPEARKRKSEDVEREARKKRNKRRFE